MLNDQIGSILNVIKTFAMHKTGVVKRGPCMCRIKRYVGTLAFIIVCAHT